MIKEIIMLKISNRQMDVSRKVTNTQYNAYMSDLYTKPYFRISTYLIGFLTGYFLKENRQKQIELKLVGLS